MVTDDKGRFVIPDLPNAKFKVWARDYGLTDSPKAESQRGKNLNLTAVKAPNEKAAAQYYPAIYWYTLLEIPGKSPFGGKTDIPPKITQIDWLRQMKNIGCVGCHALGLKSTRTFPKSIGKFDSQSDGRTYRA